MDFEKLLKFIENDLLKLMADMPATDRDGIRTKIRSIKNEDELKSYLNTAWNIDIKLFKDKLEGENKKKTSVKLINAGEAFFGSVSIYYDNAGLWWMWDEEKYWKVVDEVDILNMVNEKTGANVTHPGTRGEILNQLKQLGRKNKPKDMSNNWIAFKNGIVDINSETFELIEPSKEYFVTNIIPWEIGDSDETQRMDELFDEWVGKEKENVQKLYEIIAYSMYRDYPLHRIFCLIGAGSNGKGSYIGLLNKFLGQKNCTSTDLDVLLISRFEITKLHKKLACMMGETNFNEMSKTSILKKLVGQDLIGFEYKNKQPFDERNYAKIIIATNNLPTTTDKTIGFYRRWDIIDFPILFSEEKDILNTIPEIEYNNLTLKCVKILKNLLIARKFTNEGNIEDRQKRYEDRSDPLEKFFKEEIIEDYDNFIWKHIFTKRLNEWLRENRFRQVADHTLGRKMREKGITVGRREASWVVDKADKRLGVWEGISWKTDAESMIKINQTPQAELRIEEVKMDDGMQ